MKQPTDTVTKAMELLNLKGFFKDAKACGMLYLRISFIESELKILKDGGLI